MVRERECASACVRTGVVLIKWGLSFKQRIRLPFVRSIDWRKKSEIQMLTVIFMVGAVAVFVL